MKKVYYETRHRIRNLREKKGYTRETLAEIAEISPKFLYEIESGVKGFSADTLYKLTIALNANAHYLLFGKENDSEVNVFIKNLDKEYQKDLVRVLECIYKILKRNTF